MKAVLAKNSIGSQRLVVFAILATLLSLALVDDALGQSVQINQAYLARAQAELPSPATGTATTDDLGAIAESPNDSDLGDQQILKRVERYQPFNVSAGVPFYWTSNVALTRDGEQSDFIVAPAAGISFEPRLAPTLTGLIAVREQLFYYDRFDDFDFGSFDFEIGLRYVIPQWHDLTLRIEYDYNRLTKKNSFDDFFSDHLFIANAELPFRFGNSQFLSLGATANISATAEPEEPRRNDYEIYAGYTAYLTRAFSVTAVGRIVVRDYYHQHARVDVSEVLSLGAYYQLTKYVGAGAIGTFAASQSNHSVFNYEVANGGGIVSLWIRF